MEESAFIEEREAGRLKLSVRFQLHATMCNYGEIFEKIIKISCPGSVLGQQYENDIEIYIFDMR